MIAGTLIAGAACVAALCQADALAPALAALQAQTAASRPVHVLVLGDSHTAGDAITGPLRDALRARAGNGGRGLMPAGRPHVGVRTRGVRAAMAGPWASRGLFGPGAAEAWPPRGLTGYTLTSRTPGASLSLSVDPGEEFTAFGVCVAAGPDGPKLAVTAGGAALDGDFATAEAGPVCRRFPLGPPASSARLELVSGEAIITGWWLERGPGVIVSNLGVPGSHAQFLARADAATMAAQLAALPPDLIVLAFGTNEGFAPNVDAVRVENQLRAVVALLRRLAGPVPILLLGAPDAASRNGALAGNLVNAVADGPRGAAVDCNAAIRASASAGERLPVAGFDIPVWNDANPNLATDPVVLTAGPAFRDVRRGGLLFTPPGVPAVAAAQARVAAELGLAFWDWRGRQGGRCAAVRWTQERLMGPDFIHYSPAGGAEVARMLLADLDAARAEAAR